MLISRIKAGPKDHHLPKSVRQSILTAAAQPLFRSMPMITRRVTFAWTQIRKDVGSSDLSSPSFVAQRTRLPGAHNNYCSEIRSITHGGRQPIAQARTLRRPLPAVALFLHIVLTSLSSRKNTRNAAVTSKVSFLRGVARKHDSTKRSKFESFFRPHYFSSATRTVTMKVRFSFASLLASCSAASLVVGVPADGGGESAYLKEILLGRCYHRPPTVDGEPDDCPTIVATLMSVLESHLDSDIQESDFDSYIKQSNFAPPKDAALLFSHFSGEDPNLVMHPPRGLVSPEDTPGGAL